MKINAHIPTQQYGFIELTDLPDDPAAVEKAYNKYAEVPIRLKAGTTKRLKDLFGNSIDYDEVNHVYSWEGNQYESGSQYAKKKQKPFDATLMSGKVAEKTGADPLEIAKLWERGGKISRDFGVTVHEALEVYGKFKSLSDSLEKEYHIPNHPVLKNIVESFYVGREAEKAEYEVLVVDHATKRAGTIDRLLITAPKTCIVEDYKIAHKEDLEYWTDQLTFYAGILEANGWKVTGRTIHQYNGEWKVVAV